MAPLEKKLKRSFFVAVLAAVIVAPVAAFQVTTINVGGSASGTYLDPANPFYALDLGANTEVLGFGWDLNIAGNSPAGWNSDLRIALDTVDDFFFDVIPAPNSSTGAPAAFTSNGIILFDGADPNFFINYKNQPSFNLGESGLLLMEFWAAFANFGGASFDGTVSVAYQPIPEPATMIGLAAGAALLAARRRRNRA